MTETSLNPAKTPQNYKKDLHFCKSCGADTRIRTGDLILTNGNQAGKSLPGQKTKIQWANVTNFKIHQHE